MNRCCRAIGLSKGTWHYRQTQYQGSNPDDEHVLEHLRDLVQKHEGYGWRRLKPDLEDRLGEPVNHKRLKRLLRENLLGQERSVPKHAPSAVDRLLEEHAGSLELVNGRKFAPMEVFVTDFTELKYGSGQKAKLMAVQDKVSKVILGWAVGPSANTDLALRCWRRSRAALSDLGIDPATDRPHRLGLGLPLSPVAEPSDPP